MFRQMRRFKQQLDDTEAKAILTNAKRGALSVMGDNDYPYGIPLNFYYNEDDNAIYFHSARSGHKLDAIDKHDKVCFTVWQDKRVDEKDGWSWHVESVVVFGRAKRLKSAIEKVHALTADSDQTGFTEEETHPVGAEWERLKDRAGDFAKKYYPSEQEALAEVDSSDFDRMEFVKIEIEHMTGKRVHER